jgi:hypothetical protein
MEWTYVLQKVRLVEKPKNYVVQVVSHPRLEDDYVQVKFFTNLDSHSTHVSVNRGKDVHTYSLERDWSERAYTKKNTSVVRTQYMVYTRSLHSNHVPQIRCGRLFLCLVEYHIS